MALKHYIATTAAADTRYTLIEVATGYELAVVSTRISGGTNGGDLDIEVWRGAGASPVVTIKFSLAANDVVVVDTKDFYEAGDTVKIKGSATGMTVEMSGDYSATA